MITNSKQVWEVGETVKIGFLTLRITAKEPTPGDHMPDAYYLTNARGDRKYRFVPHYGLERLEAPTEIASRVRFQRRVMRRA